MDQIKQHTFEELNELLTARRYSTLIQRMDDMHHVDAADFLASLPIEQLPFVFRILKKDTAAEIFAELEPDLQSSIIEHLTDREMGEIIEELATDDAVDLLEEMPASVVNKILRHATPETRTELNRFLSYPEDSVGSVMTSELIDLRKSMTCAMAVERIRRTGLDKETVYVAYVTDEKRILQGVVPLKSLLFSQPDQTIEEIMDTSVIYARTLDDRETATELIAHYDLLALPIVDAEKRLVGIVTVDDAMDVMEEEATKDIERMAAILPADKPYLKTTVWETWKNRIPWLLLLMISATFTSAIITHYEAAIGTYAILTAFFPMLMDTGGNAGGQTSVTVIRGMSLGEIHLKDVLRVLWKEFRVSLLCGITLAVATFFKVYAFDFRFQAATVLENGSVQNNLLIAAIISVTVLCAIIVAKLVGTLLPMGAKRLGWDPAVMASPFITTIVDTVVLILYFTIASSLLPFH